MEFEIVVEVRGGTAIGKIELPDDLAGFDPKDLALLPVIGQKLAGPDPAAFGEEGGEAQEATGPQIKRFLLTRREIIDTKPWR